MSVRQCFLCHTTLHTSYNPHCNIHNKLLCLPCKDQLLMQPLPPSPQVLPAPSSPVTIYLKSNLFLTCPIHDFALSYICDDCEEAGCQQCINDHPERAYQDLVSVVESRLRDLQIVEYLARLVMLRRLDANAEALVEEIRVFYETVKDAAPFPAYLKLSHVVSSFWSRVQGLYPAFQPHTPLQVLATLPLRHATDNSSVLHWSHWGSNSLYFLDIETREREKLSLGPDFTIPLFSRTALLPDGDVFLCGGRTAANGFSLKTCWRLSPHSDSPVSCMPDLLFGRSNHWVLFYLDYIYVISGCDQNNKFTNKCERFSLTTHTWQMISGTNETRDSVSAVCDARFDCLYTAGGRIDNGILANSVERYEVGANVWTLLSVRLPFAGSMQGIAVLPGCGTRLLVFGGLTPANQATTRVAIVDIERETAFEVAAMKGDGGCIVDAPVVYGGSVYTLAFSGFAARTWEKWSGRFEEWESLPTYQTH